MVWFGFFFSMDGQEGEENCSFCGASAHLFPAQRCSGISQAEIPSNLCLVVASASGRDMKGVVGTLKRCDQMRAHHRAGSGMIPFPELFPWHL